VSQTEETASGRRPSKRASAFRTIGEVAGDIEVPAHVLRFWESKFPQLKPLKRGGGRRYYRPEDIELLRRIRQCLYQDGYTIRGVQKLLREGGLDGEGFAAGSGDADAPPTLFPLDAESSEEAAPPLPARPGRRPPVVHQVPDGMRASLEELRRELLEIRALVAELARDGR